MNFSDNIFSSPLLRKVSGTAPLLLKIPGTAGIVLEKKTVISKKMDNIQNDSKQCITETYTFESVICVTYFKPI